MARYTKEDFLQEYNVLRFTKEFDARLKFHMHRPMKKSGNGPKGVPQKHLAANLEVNSFDLLKQGIRAPHTVSWSILVNAQPNFSTASEQALLKWYLSNPINQGRMENILSNLEKRHPSLPVFGQYLNRMKGKNGGLQVMAIEMLYGVHCMQAHQQQFGPSVTYHDLPDHYQFIRPTMDQPLADIVVNYFVRDMSPKDLGNLLLGRSHQTRNLITVFYSSLFDGMQRYLYGLSSIGSGEKARVGTLNANELVERIDVAKQVALEHMERKGIPRIPGCTTFDNQTYRGAN